MSFVPVWMMLMVVYGRNDRFGIEIDDPGENVNGTLFLFLQVDPSKGLTHDQVAVIS